MALMQRETSTRSAALIRIGLVGIIWARHGDDFMLWRDMYPSGLALAALFYGSTFAMLFGIASQPAAFIAGAVQLYCYYGIGGDYVHHHTYLLAVATLLMGLVPSGRSYSLSRWWALSRGGEAPPERGPTWALSLITFQLSMAYFWGAIDKSVPHYLSGERLEQITMYLYFGSDYPSFPGFHVLMMLSAWVSVALEYWIAIALWLPKQRRAAIIIGVLFHGFIYMTMPVSTFTVTMWLLYLAACDPDAIHRAIDKMHGHPDSDVTRG